ncbi:glycosyltransferase family 2 protein [Stieleria sp. TO1_6]|uniref:glycosyltransferase family 2 protein n=1 Tax=Stieleria tagensis TaxID=2956795 RepID=UPI00209A700D|nr:glycosyltransferase family 2 protein [Stieleria tagensis]MCO8121618.1 glycosyltransferase family 2 protein [Stieleria tagensis]
MQYSVVIPVYNRRESILASIESVVEQTYPPQEVIVVDDGSTDGTVERIQQCGANVRLLQTGGRTGACNARNMGTHAAIHDTVAFQDSDDVWLPSKMEQQLERLEEGHFDAVFCSFIKDFESGQERGGWSREIANSGSACKTLLLKKNYVSTQTLVVRKKAFETAGGFDKDLRRFQDWDLAIRLSLLMPIGFVDEPLVRVKQTGTRLSNNRREGIISRRRILEKYKNHYLNAPEIHSQMLLDLGLRQACIPQPIAASKSLLKAARYLISNTLTSTKREAAQNG